MNLNQEQVARLRIGLIGAFTPAPAPTTTIPTVTAAPEEKIVVQQITIPAPVSPATPAQAKPNQGVQISGNNWSIAITSTTQFQQGAVNESEQHVTIEKGNTVTTFGTGFLPFTQVDVYVYSTPQWLGSVITDAQGNYVVTLNMPASLPEGDHIFQAQGTTYDNVPRTANVPIRLVPAVLKKPGILKFSVFFPLDKYYLDSKAQRAITSAYAKVKSQLTTESKISVSIIGWVQPRGGVGNDFSLAKNRAKTVTAALKKLGLTASYVLKAQGRDIPDAPKSRRTDVTVQWTATKLTV